MDDRYTEFPHLDFEWQENNQVDYELKLQALNKQELIALMRAKDAIHRIRGENYNNLRSLNKALVTALIIVSLSHVLSTVIRIFL